MTINEQPIETWALIAAVIAPTMRRKNPHVTFEEIRDEAKRLEKQSNPSETNNSPFRRSP